MAANSITSNKFKKIIGLILVLLTLFAYVGATLIPSSISGEKNYSLWEYAFLNGASSGNSKFGAFILIGLFAVAVLCLLLSIAPVIKKGNRNYFSFQCVVAICLVVSILINLFFKVVGKNACIFIYLSLAFDLLATTYYILCVIFNRDLMYYVPTEEELKELSNPVEEDNIDIEKIKELNNEEVKEQNKEPVVEEKNNENIEKANSSDEITKQEETKEMPTEEKDNKEIVVETVKKEKKKVKEDKKILKNKKNKKGKNK